MLQVVNGILTSLVVVFSCEVKVPKTREPIEEEGIFLAGKHRR